MGNWGGAEKSAGRRGGQREAGKKGGGARVGVYGRTSERAPSMWRISWSTVELSCHALLCWSGMSSYASHQRIRWETEKTKKGKKWDILTPGSQRGERYSERRRQACAGKDTERESNGTRAIVKEPCGIQHTHLSRADSADKTMSEMFSRETPGRALQDSKL